MQLSFTKKRWNILQDSEYGHPESIAVALADSRNLAPIHPELTIASPDIFPDMHIATARIQSAIANKEHICIFGDYDCDGITSAAQLVRYFLRNGVGPTVRLPHRVKDGYGLNTKIVQEFIQRKVDLLITVDTGVASVEEVSMLQEAGIDTIITDHHQPPEVPPNATAILHPMLCEYPLPHPSGAGVAFQLVRALEGNKWNEFDTDIALAMIGTVADLVELKGDNRQLVGHGLIALRKLENSPLNTFMDTCGIKQYRASSSDVGFRIAPRINAAGRMDDPELALRALLGDAQMLEKIDTLNSDRQTQTSDLCNQAITALDIAEKEHNEIPVLLHSASPDYQHGIIGLIAGRLTEQFGKPSIVAAEEENVFIASLRSPPSYNIVEGLTRCKHLLERFGGHAQAAGCTVAAHNWDELLQSLTQDIQDHTDQSELVPTITVDSTLRPSDITLAFCNSMSHLEPFGQGNKEPIFLLKNVKLDGLRCVGSEHQHLQCKIGYLKCISFGLGQFLSQCDDMVDIVATCSINEWNGHREPQLQIMDIAKAEQ